MTPLRDMILRDLEKHAKALSVKADSREDLLTLTLDAVEDLYFAALDQGLDAFNSFKAKHENLLIWHNAAMAIESN